MATSAKAGSYAVSYSGGSGQKTDQTGASTTSPYTVGSDGFYGGVYGAYWSNGYASTGPTSPTSGSSMCSGAITATFTWQATDIANDPPPTNVVVYEEEHVWGSSRDDANARATTATCSDDLGFPLVPVANTPGASIVYDGGTAGGIRYQIKQNPGASFTLTTSPSGSLSGAGTIVKPGNNVAGSGSGGTKVQYKATAAPLEIVLSGGIGPRSDKRFLIGQQVTGTVSTGGLTASGFNWTASAGNPFSNYIVVWTDTAATQTHPTSATFVPLGTQTQSQITFHFKKGPQASTISTPVTLAVPSGALPAAGLTTTLTRQCTVDAPLKTIDVHIGTVQGLPNPVSPQYMGLSGATLPEGGIAGIYWKGTVTTPSQYGSGGGWNVTQLITPNHFRTENGVMQKIPANGVLALDTTFGYRPVFPDLYTDYGVLQGSNDNPSSEYWDAGTSVTSANDSFNDYMMYLPNGAGSCFVPLKEFDWSWAGQAKPDGSGGWQISYTNSGWSLGAEYPAHPTWTTNVGQGLNYVNK